MILDYFSLSVSSLKKRKLRAWLTLLGIFIGIAAVVSLISLGTGLRTAVTGQFSSLSADNLIVQNAGTSFGPPGSTTITKLNEHDVKAIERAAGIKYVIPRLLRITSMEYNRNTNYYYTISMPNNQNEINAIYDIIGIKTTEGRLLKQGDVKKVVLGSNVAEKSQWGKQIAAGTRIKINGEDFEVSGILEKSSSFQVNIAIIMIEEDMKNLLDIGDEWDLILVKVQDKNQIESIARNVENEIRKDRKEKLGEEDFSVQTPLQAVSAVNTILNIINLIVIGIASISLVVGGIGIMNTMYTSVLERTREIGTMKAIGAKNSDILYIFLIESGLLGLVGGIIGVFLGLLMSFLVSALSASYFGQEIIKFQISWLLVLGAMAFSILIGIFAGITPAYQASRLKPVDALRG